MSVSILIEGPDGSGKTYLAERLIENLKASYIHGQHVQKQYLDDVCERMINSIDLLLENNSNVITDRFVYSQIIYEGLFGKDSRNDHEHLLKWYLKHFDYQIICAPENTEQYLQTFEQLKSERFEDYDIMTDVYSCYKQLYYGEGVEGLTSVSVLLENNLFLDICNKGGLQKNEKCFIYDRFTGLLKNNKETYTIEEFCKMVGEE